MTERREVRRTYDRIGDHFAKTRPEPWPEVSRFLANRTGDTGLDVGVGNGRHAEAMAGRVDRVIGLDASRVTLGTARERAATNAFGAELVQGDASTLPIATGRIDLAVYIATLHHLPTRRLRQRSLDELARVLGPDGVALVSVWSTTHDRFDRESGFDTTVEWTLPDGEAVPRYYHIYDPAEFRRAIERSALSLDRTFTASGNCYAVVGPAKQ